MQIQQKSISIDYPGDPIFHFFSKLGTITAIHILNTTDSKKKPLNMLSNQMQFLSSSLQDNLLHKARDILIQDNLITINSNRAGLQIVALTEKGIKVADKINELIAALLGEPISIKTVIRTYSMFHIKIYIYTIFALYNMGGQALFKVFLESHPKFRKSLAIFYSKNSELITKNLFTFEKDDVRRVITLTDAGTRAAEILSQLNDILLKDTNVETFGSMRLHEFFQSPNIRSTAHKKRVLRTLDDTINRICSGLNVPDSMNKSVKAMAFRLYSRIYDQFSYTSQKYKSPNGLGAVCVYQALRKHKMKYTWQQVADAAEVPEAKFRKIFKKAAFYFRYVPRTEIVEKLIKSIQSELTIPDPIYNRALNILDRNRLVALSTTSNVSAAACMGIAVLSEKRRNDFRMSHISSSINASPSAVRYRIIKMLRHKGYDQGTSISELDKTIPTFYPKLL